MGRLHRVAHHEMYKNPRRENRGSQRVELPCAPSAEVLAWQQHVSRVRVHRLTFAFPHRRPRIGGALSPSLDSDQHVLQDQQAATCYDPPSEPNGWVFKRQSRRQSQKGDIDTHKPARTGNVLSQFLGTTNPRYSVHTSACRECVPSQHVVRHSFLCFRFARDKARSSILLPKSSQRPHRLRAPHENLVDRDVD